MLLAALMFIGCNPSSNNNDNYNMTEFLEFKQGLPSNLVTQSIVFDKITDGRDFVMIDRLYQNGGHYFLVAEKNMIKLEAEWKKMGVLQEKYIAEIININSELKSKSTKTEGKLATTWNFYQGDISIELDQGKSFPQEIKAIQKILDKHVISDSKD